MSNEKTESKLGSGIVKSSARPLAMYVDSDNEVWMCDADVAEGSDYASAGCSATSSNPHNS